MDVAPPSTSSHSTNIKVFIRVRPPSDAEIAREDKSGFVITPDSLGIRVLEGDKASSKSTRAVSRQKQRVFYFDGVMPDSTTQEDVFHLCGISELIDSVFEGYSATVFAYGITGSGKTHTLTGPEDDGAADHPFIMGAIPRAISRVAQLQRTKYHGQCKSTIVQASYLEIYNEQVNDLLNPDSTNLRMRWSPSEGFFVEGLFVVECRGEDDLKMVLAEGLSRRKVGENEVNKDSSRSHCIFSIFVDSEVALDDETTVHRYGKIHLVDLAGSERIRESFHDRLVKETQHINKSLLTLGKVISALSEPGDHFVPYRDSKLTKMLMDSLGGSARTSMISCISLSAHTFDETLNTLNYSSRARNIRNRPMINMDPKEQLIQILKEENEALRRENYSLRRLIGVQPSDSLSAFPLPPALEDGMGGEGRGKGEDKYLLPREGSLDQLGPPDHRSGALVDYPDGTVSWDDLQASPSKRPIASPLLLGNPLDMRRRPPSDRRTIPGHMRAVSALSGQSRPSEIAARPPARAMGMGEYSPSKHDPVVLVERNRALELQISQLIQENDELRLGKGMDGVSYLLRGLNDLSKTLERVAIAKEKEIPKPMLSVSTEGGSGVSEEVVLGSVEEEESREEMERIKTENVHLTLALVKLKTLLSSKRDWLKAKEEVRSSGLNQVSVSDSMMHEELNGIDGEKNETEEEGEEEGEEEEDEVVREILQRLDDEEKEEIEESARSFRAMEGLDGTKGRGSVVQSTTPHPYPVVVIGQRK
eukprot:TRINITY_DN9709_c1_g1_i1.p1 TRINITY_DN9709_c1_g1~~TRINITY_DN9709_c1_g1_i1.p1  ORF type:complete len:761 (-),score=208.82 TRINITY_DN9709_c1_g1_i1:418-2700(-)